MKGDVRRSKESLISFFAGPVLNKCRIVKTQVLESYLTLFVQEFIFRVQKAMRCLSLLFYLCFVAK